MGLAFVAGFVDAVTVLGLYHTFVAFVTGTIITLGLALVSGSGDALLKTIVVAGFACFSLMWIAIIRSVRDTPRTLAWFFAAEGAVLTVFAVAGTVVGEPTGPDAVGTIVLCLLGVLAMSLQNALMTILLTRHAPTTVMTGNVVRFLVSVEDLARGGLASVRADPDARFKSRRQLLTYLVALFSFMVGVLLGAAIFLRVGFGALFVPAGILGALAAVEIMRSTRPRATPDN